MPHPIWMLGYRLMGRAHTNAMARLPMFFPNVPTVERDVWIGRDESALTQAANRFGLSRTATDWRNAINEGDVFYTHGPNHLHDEPSIGALEASDKHDCYLMVI